MPLPPPPAAGLTSSGKPTVDRRRDQRVVGLRRVRRSRGGPGRRARPRAGAPRPCRPSRGWRRRRADPADPGRVDGLGEVGVLGEEPEARVERVRAGGAWPPRRRPRRRAGRGRRDRRSPGTTARIPSRSHVRVMRAAISPRLAMNSVRIGVVGAWSRAAWPRRCDERVNRVTRDTPTSTNASRRQSTARDPALDGPRRRSRSARAAWLGLSSSDIDVAIVASTASTASSRGLYGASGRAPRPARASR